MKRLAVAALVVASMTFTFTWTAWGAAPPPDRVVAIYFHRTERCPTCLKMGSYAEEAVKQGFAKQIADGTVEFHFIDYENEKNAALTKGYKIMNPALIIAKIAGNRVKSHKDLEEIWTRVSERPDFIKYVRANVEAYLK